MLLIKKGGGLPLQLADGEGEIGVGEGFVAQREMPPLAIESLKAVTEYSYLLAYEMFPSDFEDTGWTN